MTQSGAITTATTASFSAGANAITITNAANSFGGAVSLSNSANLASITDNTPLDLGTSSVGSLAAISNGALTQSGAITTATTASFSAGANAITITNAANSFGGGVAPSTTAANLASITDNTPLSFGASSVGQLAAISNGAITQSAAVTATGVASFSAGANAITLTNAGNDFQAAVTLTNTGANNVQITDSTGLSLAASSVGQDLTVIRSAEHTS